MSSKLRLGMGCGVLFLLVNAPLAWCDSDSAQFVDYSLHDDHSRINCDVAHVKIPQGWGVKGAVQWNLNVMMPGKWYVCAANLQGPELWIRYPGQAFVWRDNFDLLGVNFQLHQGDSDPGLGDEIEQPAGSALDCIKQVIIGRYRKELANATVVSAVEMTPDEAMSFANAIVPDVMNSPQAQQLQIVPKGATMRLEYSLSGKTMQEDFKLLVLYFDLPGGTGAVHVWSIPYCMSFRTEKGKLDDEEKSLAKPMDESVKQDQTWSAKRDEVVKQAAQAYGDRLRQLAQAEESNIIANMNRNIFNMCQESYHRRMDLEQQTFHSMDNAINGQSDYALPNGQTITAPIAPMGQTAWRDGTGAVKFFNDGVNPNGVAPGSYEQMSEK